MIYICLSLVVPDVFVYIFKIVLVHVVNYDNVIICVFVSHCDCHGQSGVLLCLDQRNVYSTPLVI